MAKAMRNPVRRRVLAALGLAALVVGIWAWWAAGQWRPRRDLFPVQGVETAGGDVNFAALRKSGADFVYLDASVGSAGHTQTFEQDLAAAREAGLQVGAVHRFDVCRDAGSQVGNFVTLVPRDAKLLPPAVELDLDEAACPAPPAAEALQSELTTFLNQLERHTGKRSVLKLSKAFESRYHVAGMIDRAIWATGGWWPLDGYLAPGYAGRPWDMWTANPRLRSPASLDRLQWVVVRP